MQPLSRPLSRRWRTALAGLVLAWAAAEAPAGITVGTASLSVEKVGPATVTVGVPLQYEIRVRNTGTQTARGVVIHEQLPPDSRFVSASPATQPSANLLTWRLGDLPAGQARTITVVVIPARTGRLRNCVTYSLESCAETCVTQPRLALAKTGPEQAILGQEVVFTVEVSNTGDGPARNVVLVDTLAPGLVPEGQPRQLRMDVGELAPGQSRLYQVRSKAVAAGRHCNEAVVTADGGLKLQAAACVNVLVPQLNVGKTGPARAFLKCPITYAIAVSNPGAVPVANVTLIDALPAGLAFVAASANGRLDPAANTVTWALGDLAPGASRAVTLTVRGTALGRHCNRIRAEGAGLVKWAELCTEVQGVPGVLLELTDDRDALTVGETVTFTIRVTNQGSTDLHRVAIGGVLDPALAGLEAGGHSAGAFAGQQFTFPPLDVLAVGQQVTFHVKARGLRPADARTRLTLTAAELERTVTEEESTHFYE